MLPDRLTLQPIARFEGTLQLPGSKSLSNRVLLLSALSEGETEVTRVLDSEDTDVMLAALRTLGVGVRGLPGPHGSMWITGKGGPLGAPSGPLQLSLGNAGTAMRPLTAVLAAGHGIFTLSGVPRMHERPIGDLLDGLRQLGVHVSCLEREGFPPLRIDAKGLRGGSARISGATSSQFLSALLMAAPLAAGFLRYLANEFGKDGILVNNVGPGYTATERLKQLAKTRSAALGKAESDIFDSWAADAPLRRVGQPREVADAIVWLASERASYVTGQTVLVDGGVYKGL